MNNWCKAASVSAMLAVVGVIPYVVQAEDKNVIQDGGFEVVDRYQTVVKSHWNKIELKKEYNGIGDPIGDPSGSIWARGRWSFRNISHYIHYSKYCQAYSQNGHGDYINGGWQEPGTWSRAEVVWTWIGGNKAGYNYKDIHR